jgi:hypothetical protein
MQAGKHYLLPACKLAVLQSTCQDYLPAIRQADMPGCLQSSNQDRLLSIRLARLPSFLLSCQHDGKLTCFHAGFHGET